MLTRVVTRQAQQGIVIGDDVTVTVLEIVGNAVRLGIHNPHAEPSYREQTLQFRPQTLQAEFSAPEMLASLRRDALVGTVDQSAR